MVYYLLKRHYHHIILWLQQLPGAHSSEVFGSTHQQGEQGISVCVATGMFCACGVARKHSVVVIIKFIVVLQHILHFEFVHAT